MSARGKGKAGEREAAKLLGAWWAPLEPEAKWATTPQSGGWAGPQLRGEFKVAGDLITTAKRWPFTVEVKRREAWSLSVLLEGRPSPVWGWWRQCCAAAAEEGRQPLLLFRKNKDPWLVGMAVELGRALPSIVLGGSVIATDGRPMLLAPWARLERAGAEGVELAALGVARRLATPRVLTEGPAAPSTLPLRDLILAPKRRA